MMTTKIRERAAAAALIVGFAWLVLPLIHDLRHLCPVRPDGVAGAGAVPAFARKYGMSCTQCHTAWPLLNDYGRQFKLNGYVPDGLAKEGVVESKDGSYHSEKLFPWGAIVRSRVFEKNPGVPRIGVQGVSDVDLFIAGGDAASHVSWFGEFDAPASGGFAPGGGDFQLGYHPSSYLNVLGARRGFFVMDPFQTLTTLGNVATDPRATELGQAGQSSLSGNKMNDTTQTVAAYGTADKEGLGYLYYAAGMTSGDGKDNGRGSRAGSGRLAFDTTKGLVVGGFGSFGRDNASASGFTAKFSRVGVDALVEKAGFVGRGVYMFTHDSDVTGKEDNKAAYAELMYVFKSSPLAPPFLVPLVRENWYSTTDGTAKFNYITAQLAHYFTANTKAFIDYTFDTARGDAAAKDHHIAAQVEVGF